MNGERVTTQGAEMILRRFENEVRCARAATLRHRASPDTVRAVRQSGLDYAYLRRVLLGRVKED